MKTYSIIYTKSTYIEAACAFEQVFQSLDYSLSENIEDSDIILIMDRYQLDAIIAQNNIQSKIILFFLKSEISLFWDVDISKIDRIIIGIDTNLKILYPWRNLCYEVIPPSTLISQTKTNNSCDKNIFVNLEEKHGMDMGLLKIVRILNKMNNLKFTVVSDIVSKNIFNNNVTIINSSSNLDSYICSADMIIGAGYTALKGLTLGKKVIVIGERGYGGIPSINNIDLFYNEFFQGVIGGRLDGPIPESLMIEDIKSPSMHDLAEIKNKVISLQNESLKKLKNIIKQIDLLSDSLKFNYKFNSDYTIIKDFENNYWLLNRYTRLLIAILNPAVGDKLSQLYSGKTSPNFSSEELGSLIQNKVLIN